MLHRVAPLQKSRAAALQMGWRLALRERRTEEDTTRRRESREADLRAQPSTESFIPYGGYVTLEIANPTKSGLQHANAGRVLL